MKEMTAQISREVASFCRQGNEEVNKGNQEKAIIFFEKAYKKSRELDDDYRERVCALNLGAAYLAHGKAQEGLQYLHKAKPPGEKKDGRSNGDLFYNIAYAYSSLKDFRNALEYYDMACREYRTERDNMEMERECVKRSIVIYEQHYRDHGKAAEMYGKLADLQDSDGIQQAISQCEQANQLRLADKQEEAESTANNCLQKIESVASLESNQYSKDVGRLYNDLGLVYTQLMNYDSSLQCFELALPRVRSAHDKQLEAVVLQNLGAAYNFVGDYQRAIKFLEDAAGLFAELKNRNSQGQCFANLGFAYSQLPNTEGAEEAFLHAKQAAIDTRDNHSLWQVLEGLGSVKCNQGRLDKAAEYFQEALSYVGKNKEAAKRIREKLKHVIQLEVQYEMAAQRGTAYPYMMSARPGSGAMSQEAKTVQAVPYDQTPTVGRQPPVIAKDDQLPESGPSVSPKVKQRFLQMRKKDSFGPHHPKMARGLSASMPSYDSPRFKMAFQEEELEETTESDSSYSDSDSSSTDEQDGPQKSEDSPTVQEIFRRTPSTQQRPTSRQVTLRRDDDIKKYQQVLLEQDEEDQQADSSDSSEDRSDSSEDEKEKVDRAKVAISRSPVQKIEESEESDSSDESSSKEEDINVLPPIPTQSPPNTSILHTYEKLPGEMSTSYANSGSAHRSPGPSGDRMEDYTAVDPSSKTQKPQSPEDLKRGNDQKTVARSDKRSRPTSGNFFRENSESEDDTQPSGSQAVPKNISQAGATEIRGVPEDTGNYDRLNYRKSDIQGDNSEDSDDGGVDRMTRAQREMKLYEEHQRIRQEEQDRPPPLPQRPEKPSKTCVIM